MSQQSSITRPVLFSVTATAIAVVSGGLLGSMGATSACADWPICADLSTPLAWLNMGHRLLVATAALLALGVALFAWRQPSLGRGVRTSLLAAPLVLLAQALGTGLWRDSNPALVEMGHLAGALLALGLQSYALAVLLAPTPPTPERTGGRTARSTRQLTSLAWWSALAGGIAVVAIQAQALPNSGLISAGLPTNGSSTLAIAGGLAVATLVQTVRLRRNDSVLLRLSAGVLLSIALLSSLLLLPPHWDALGRIGGATLVISSVLLATLISRRPLTGVAAPATVRSETPSLLNDYLSLTKPKVISLLLVTTLAAMYITEAGAPSLWLVLWTMIGGYLAAGGAGAINCAFDSDIDINMGRTSRRPVPSGRIPRSHAMAFGLTLSALAIIVLLVFTTPLAAGFAALGIVYYAVFYTQWLKRSTWQNIVIGGGAGAIPPLVGWTAVTGTLSPAALLLFAIIFYWTPPHFWALALVKQQDYTRAGVPMLPVVAGVAETRWQIMVYSVLMFALSLLLTPMGAMGWIYLIGAIILGVIFLHSAWGVWRRGGQAEIWWLYKYSLLYLALLFAVMVLDRVVL
jgi:protoheme IX farnesyltransferase